jgi:FlaA1/EpsC-like NDP-sugar epimerase
MTERSSTRSESAAESDGGERSAASHSHSPGARYLIELPRHTKWLLAVTVDACLCILTTWLAICLRFESWVNLADYQWLSVALSVALAIPLLAVFGFYRTVVRFAGRQTILSALQAVGVYTIIYSAIFTVYSFPLVPRTIGVLQPLLLLIGLALVRLLASQWLGEHASSHTGTPQSTALIYGAGTSGQQLASYVASRGQLKIVGFLDDNINLRKATIAGITVFHPSQLEQLLHKHQVKSVLLAIPGLSRGRRREIIELLTKHRLVIRTLPSLADLISGKAKPQELREIALEDLLGRDPVSPQSELMERNISGKTVLVTGAGGSIGSELCRQIVQHQPTRLILLERSEFSLYAIDEELRSLALSAEIVPILCDVLDASALDTVFKQYQPFTVYHTAAYKHVPLVETNAFAGVRNNVLGTYHVGRACVDHGVEHMVLISTDKAVRPTNIMGASKRAAEMALQWLAHSGPSTAKTQFCYVRFGNVLGSSGSVIPKFKAQILNGGPVTVTHPEITRYFMTIPEAAQLVIQAAAINPQSQQTAQAYILDMGPSVLIRDLARAMILLSGYSVRDATHPTGDIAIEFTGLRPGEKLYEELTIDQEAVATVHPKIMTTQDEPPQFEVLDGFIKTLREAHSSTELDSAALSRFLIDLGTHYSPSNGKTTHGLTHA